MEALVKGGFLGRGWSSPPTFVKGPNVVLMSEAEKNIRENLMNLFNTRLSERPFRAAYGTDIWKQLFTPANAIPVGELESDLTKAIKEYEPRVVLEEVKVDVDLIDSPCLVVSVLYTEIATNSRHNFVFPYYLNEGTHVDQK